jgi:hypothetical protein
MSPKDVLIIRFFLYRVVFCIVLVGLCMNQDDMRNLKKTDKNRVDALIRQGGKQLQEWTSQTMRTYSARLDMTPDDFFALDPAAPASSPPSLDGTTPILYLDIEG